MQKEEKDLKENLSKWVDEGMDVYLSFFTKPNCKGGPSI